ncbi:hypothetical protein CH362_07725 [Leptospira saintgironsiae]|uniref:Uncharacterized protein n=1 Tax=Leptospira saintgironsiae TaxID=2023183 RepID=A0A2M9YCM8_9LEPT|nr:hypothetical protein CH362_07725 [Leptospira saintgironsiae]
MTPRMKFAYKERCKLYSDVVIIADPDRWDRFKTGGAETLISQEEYQIRMSQSTILRGKRFDELSR